MKTLLISMLVSLALTSCKSEAEDAAARRASEFDVVSEGSTSGVASTIGGAPADANATLTSTNVDTTTAFAVLNDPNLATEVPADPNLAGQLPPPVAVNDSRTPRPSAPPRPSTPPSIKIERVEPPPPPPPPPAEPTEPEIPEAPEEPAEEEPTPAPPTETPPPPPPPPPGSSR